MGEENSLRPSRKFESLMSHRHEDFIQPIWRARDPLQYGKFLAPVVVQLQHFVEAGILDD